MHRKKIVTFVGKPPLSVFTFMRGKAENIFCRDIELLSHFRCLLYIFSNERDSQMRITRVEYF